MKLLDIWTQCAEKFKNQSKKIEPWRVVEGQYDVSTRKLVDSLEEQAILEEMIDSVKPKLRDDLHELHYLLSTPFRHPPLKNGSRFGTRQERGIYYGSETPATSFSETAYYRFFFLNGMTQDPGLVELNHTLFQAQGFARSFADLTEESFQGFQGELASPVSYEWTQLLGTAMRKDGMDAFRFQSARDPEKGINFGIFEPQVFTKKSPVYAEAWRSYSTKQRVEFLRLDSFKRESYSFPITGFLVSGQFPHPAI